MQNRERKKSREKTENKSNELEFRSLDTITHFRMFAMFKDCPEKTVTTFTLERQINDKERGKNKSNEPDL